MKKVAIDRFFNNILLIKNGATVDLFESSVDATFERICSAILKNHRTEGIWYDGTSDLSILKQDAKKIEFKGSMNVMEGQRKHWIEPFSAKVYFSDKAADCIICIVCGEYESSGNLYEMFGYENN